MQDLAEMNPSNKNESLKRLEGLSVLVVEGKESIGGGLRTAALTLPGYLHDVCSAIHPLAAGSPYLSKLPLAQHGLQFIYPSIAAAHPFDDGSAAVLLKSIDETASRLSSDKKVYRQLIGSLVDDWSAIINNILDLENDYGSLEESS